VHGSMVVTGLLILVGGPRQRNRENMIKVDKRSIYMIKVYNPLP
jgi:hypothetical protein